MVCYCKTLCGGASSDSSVGLLWADNQQEDDCHVDFAAEHATPAFFSSSESSIIHHFSILTFYSPWPQSNGSSTFPCSFFNLLLSCSDVSVITSCHVELQYTLAGYVNVNKLFDMSWRYKENSWEVIGRKNIFKRAVSILFFIKNSVLATQCLPSTTIGCQSILGSAHHPTSSSLSSGETDYWPILTPAQ